MVYYEKQGNIFGEQLMRPKMHSLSYVFALSAASVALSVHYRFLKVPFWALLTGFAIYEAGESTRA